MTLLNHYRLFIDDQFPEDAINPSGALVMGLGNSTVRALTAQSGAKFVSIYTENSYAGDAGYNTYLRHYISGAAGDGIALRSYATVSDVTAANARGAHISLDFGTSGKVTGLGVALECTLHIPNSATQSGTIAALKVAINSDGSTSNTSGATSVSYIRVDNQGDGTGAGHVDDDACLFDINGHTISSGNMIEASVTEANYSHSIRIRIGGTLYYLMAAAQKG